MADAPAAAPRPVLVLYAPADEAFVRGFLLPALGPAAPDGKSIDEVERKGVGTLPAPPVGRGSSPVGSIDEVERKGVGTLPAPPGGRGASPVGSIDALDLS